MPFPVVFQELLQDPAGREVGTIGFDPERLTIVREHEYGRTDDPLLQLFKRHIAFRGPAERHVLLGEIEERTCNLREPFNEPSVEVRKSRKDLNLLLLPGLWPFRYRSYLDRIHCDLVVRYDQSEVLDLLPLELALLRLEVQLVFPESFQDNPGDPTEFLPGFREHKDVVHVNTDNSLPYQVREDVVHHRLERRRTVCESEEHHKRLEQSPVRPECGFPLVALLDPDIVVSPPDVQLSEVPGTLESLN